MDVCELSYTHKSAKWLCTQTPEKTFKNSQGNHHHHHGQKKKKKKPPPWKVSLFSFRTWTFDKVIITEAYMCVYTHTKVQQHFLLLFRSFIYSFLHLFFFSFIAISLGSPLLFYISSSKAAVTQPLSVFLPKCRVCCNRETHMWVAQVVNILCILIDPFSSRTVLCSPFFSALFCFS